jgi:DNA-binding transcriptional regulator LsrR (DeoR family)
MPDGVRTASAGEQDIDLQVRVAWLYHIEGLTQADIARALRISRARIVRMLSAARSSGLVQVSVDARAAKRVTLARALVARFGLREAIVVPGEAAERAAQAVGAAAGALLVRRLRPGMAIGVGWGATLNAALPALADAHAPRLSVISLLGGMTHSRAVNPAAVARRMADALHAECYQFAAPLLVARESTRDALWREPALEALRARARRARIALVSVGDVGEDATLFREGMLTRADLAGLRARGAVGDVLCQFLDARGLPVDHPVNRRAMTIGLADLHGVGELVVASGGTRKVAALKAALAALPVATLVTDEPAAEGILAS